MFSKYLSVSASKIEKIETNMLCQARTSSQNWVFQQQKNDSLSPYHEDTARQLIHSKHTCTLIVSSLVNRSGTTAFILRSHHFWTLLIRKRCAFLWLPLVLATKRILVPLRFSDFISIFSSFQSASLFQQAVCICYLWGEEVSTKSIKRTLVNVEAFRMWK